ncbi:hypothetical protein HPB48_011916 [Haemaphysalis longicornis]|uniref:Uncharacterized protein n=1 Tax=Haemaphysalis longicornis TaxID=44386 RepID=A0A9J6FPD8_HAELO|nr:hypothetical protein HPB48_011916 [Haemaphysalis longicornis]
MVGPEDGETTLHVPHAGRRASLPSARETNSAKARRLLELAAKQRKTIGRVLWVTVIVLCVLGCLSQVNRAFLSLKAA